MSFWGELKRRNVVRVGIAYLVAAWLVIQVVDVVNEPLSLPGWFATVVILLLGIGLPFALILSWAYELTPDGLKKSREVDAAESIARTTGRKIDRVIIAVLAVAVVVLVVDNYVLDGNEAEAGVIENSVAVLLCDNLSPDPDNAFFAASLHEEILNQLFKLRNLSVIARTTMLQYAGVARPIPEIAAELNVESVMECSVSYADQRVAISAQLIDGETGLHIWSERYNREFRDIFAIQSDIAMNVANALQAQFSEEEQQRLERAPTSSPVAYGLVLQAFELIGSTDQGERMHGLLDQALDIDPQYAEAYAFKAWLYAQNLINTNVSSASSEWAELERLIQEYAERALAIDPESPRAWFSLGTLASFTWRWTEAARAYDRAYEISNTEADSNVHWFRAWSDDEREALRLTSRNVELNPLFWGAHWLRGIILNYSGAYDEAAASLQDSIDLAAAIPLAHSWLALTEAARGELDEARRELALTEQILGEDRAIIFLLDIAYGYGRVGDIDDAQRLFDEITAIAEQGQDIGAGGWALIHLAVGNVDEALEWLERGVEKASRHEPDAGYYTLMNIRMNYTNDPILERPEFVDVRSRLRGD